MLKIIFRRIAVILAVAVLAAFLWRLFHVDNLPDWNKFSAGVAVHDENDQRIDISLSAAKKLYFERKAFFVDARSPEQYRKGHIRGAINVPWITVEQNIDRVLTKIKPDTTIITYCDGIQCPLSHNLAKFLIQLGYSEVKVLVNGWSAWIENGLPVEKG